MLQTRPRNLSNIFILLFKSDCELIRTKYVEMCCVVLDLDLF